MPINPKIAKLHEAVAEFCELRSQINKATLSTITEKFVGLLAARWEHIVDSAHDEENGDKIAVCININLDFAAKAPVGGINLKFTPSKINDGTSFKVGDPDQEVLPLDGGANPPARRGRGRSRRVTVVEAV